MKFFDRQNEIAKLREIRARASESATLTVMTGRRRVGKTALVKAAFSDQPFLYLFVARSAEADLCDGFKSRIEAFTGRRFPRPRRRSERSRRPPYEAVRKGVMR